MGRQMKRLFPRNSSIRSSQRGFSLLEVIIAFGILGTISATIPTQLANAYRGARRVQQVSDMAQLRLAIAKGVNCEYTYARAGLDTKGGGNCGTSSFSQGSGFISLQKSTTTGATDLISSPQESDGSRRFGDFYVRASCSSQENSLIVQAKPVYYKGHALTGKKTEWNTPEALVFGKGVGLPLCYNASDIGITAQQSVSSSRARIYLHGPNRAMTTGNNGPGTFGLRCRADEGWQLTGCFNAVSGKGDKTVSVKGDLCYAANSVGKNGPLINATLTALCLKVE